MSLLGPLPRVTLSLAITIAGIVAACHRDAPGSTTPVAPELSNDAPAPPAIDPSGVPRDAGIDGTASSSFSHGERDTRRVPLRVADVPGDAGVSDVIDLPPVPDADVDLLGDAGQPMTK